MDDMREKQQMTDTEKLNALIDYIREVGEFYMEWATKRGSKEYLHKWIVIQGLHSFMYNELGIEYEQM